ncbi:MAG: DUF4974 domain-containing protein [Gammaproteobacteria bacterium]|nr:DUF4974 domain-containing protein [Gammaproteobacteria bacterium]
MKRARDIPHPKEAADWILIAQERPLTRQESRQLAQWLRSSPANVREYMDAAVVWNDMADIDPNRRIDIDTLVSHDGVVPFPVPPAASTAPTTRRALTARISAIAASVLVAVFAGLLYWQMDAGDPKTVSTELGEQRSVALDDGSIIHLNTQSQVRIDYDKRRRFLELVEGEALFTAVEDPARLFIVRVGGAEVRVVGTQFNIRRRRDSAIVTVVAGAVRIGQVAPGPSAEGPSATSGEGSADLVEVVAGQRVGIDHAGRAGPPEDVHTDKVLTWTERRLVFDGDPLAVIAEEFNRYNAVKLKIGDPKLGDMRLSGVFSANDPASLVEYLKTVEAPTIDVRRSGTALVVHSADDRVP